MKKKKQPFDLLPGKKTLGVYVKTAQVSFSSATFKIADEPVRRSWQYPTHTLQ